MTTTLIIMAVVAAAAVCAAYADRRRRRPEPTTVHGEPPSHLDRKDFRGPESPWLIAVFTSATCMSCEAVWHELSARESSTVVAHNVEVHREADLHRRYGIDSVPTAVLVDEDGLVRHAALGPLGPADRQAIAAILAGDG